MFQVLGVNRTGQGDDEVSLDFRIAEGGHSVPTDRALATLRNLTAVQMSDIITYPVGVTLGGGGI